MSSNENQLGLWDEPLADEPDPGPSRRRRAPTAAPAVRRPEPPETTPGADRLWTVDDVSVFLGVPKKTTGAAGKDPKGFRVGKHLRWRPRTVFERSLRMEDEQ